MLGTFCKLHCQYGLQIYEIVHKTIPTIVSFGVLILVCCPKASYQTCSITLNVILPCCSHIILAVILMKQGASTQKGELQVTENHLQIGLNHDMQLHQDQCYTHTTSFSMKNHNLKQICSHLYVMILVCLTCDSTPIDWIVLHLPCM